MYWDLCLWSTADSFRYEGVFTSNTLFLHENLSCRFSFEASVSTHNVRFHGEILNFLIEKKCAYSEQFYGLYAR